ncbi:MAG: cbb3-type cytochrome c oxidase N-terminal domain-containing protein [Weeksellaceae bacterium]|nr:cbb3-type cytochrome c oxidase N-terminal domain-containing protein [Weeksellaceae bacterium]
MKQRTPGYILIPIALLIILGAFMMVIPVTEVGQDGLKYVPINAWNQITNVLSYWIVWVVFFLALIMLLVLNQINKVVERKKFETLPPEAQEAYLNDKKIGYIKRLIKSSGQRQSEAEEEAIILDHGFDGIKELDNSLPQWWVAMFYLGMIYCVIYIIAYFTTDFADPIVEYEKETAQLEAGFTEWIRSNDIDVDGATNFYDDDQILEQGKEIYTNICATCHLATGGGAAGPNLTDDAWINRVDEDLFRNIYKIVYDGSPNNPAMQAFGQTKQLTGLDVQAVASYVYYMNQVLENADGLPEQGEVVPQWSQGGAATAPATAPSTQPADATQDTPSDTPSTEDTARPITDYSESPSTTQSSQ